MADGQRHPAGGVVRSRTEPAGVGLGVTESRVATGPSPEPRVRLLAFVRGHVQGVGFRWWTTAQARRLGLTGKAKNLPDGRVEVTAQGYPQACDQLLELLTEEPTTTRRPGRVRGVTHHYLDPVTDSGRFEEM